MLMIIDKEGSGYITPLVADKKLLAFKSCTTPDHTAYYGTLYITYKSQPFYGVGRLRLSLVGDSFLRTTNNPPEQCFKVLLGI